MATEYTNFGTARVKVEILPSLPEINTNPVRVNFDITALSWPMIKNSPLMAPLLTEAAIDETKTFGALFPSKRKLFLNNYLENGEALQSAQQNGTEIGPYISWTPTTTFPEQTVLEEFFRDYPTDPYDPNVSETDASYNGPRWIDMPQRYTPPTNDDATIKSFTEWVTGIQEDEEEGGEDDENNEDENNSDESGEEDTIPYMNVVCQTQIREGLWWGVESSPFITEHMPFWVNIVKDNPPTTKKKETILVVSMGLTSTDNRFDIILSANNKPRIIDYSLGGVQKEWDVDTARILEQEKNIEIGVMVAAGRLVVFVNKEVLVYTRIQRSPVSGTTTSSENGGSIKHTKIEPGKIRIYGTNITASINACPMVFAPKAFFALSIPTTNQLSGRNDTLTWKGVKENGDPGGSVAELPTTGTNKVYGVDCENFRGSGGSCSPSGDLYQKKGEIKFQSAGQAGMDALPNTDFYVVEMTSVGNTMLSADGQEFNFKNGSCPFFFRLKGIAAAPDQGGSQGGTDISQYVINLSESETGSDYFHIKKNATVTVYNEGGILSTLTSGQKGVRISIGWDDQELVNPIFTGVITSYNLSEKAGMETITLNCEDYMFVLQNSLIVNSPFYDGMVAKAAIFDLAERAGCKNMQYEWPNEREFFLPSGFAYTQPQVRFPSSNSIFESIKSLVQRFEAYFYFDGHGIFNLKKLPGGLFSTPSSFSANFVQDPSSDDPSSVILGEKNVTYDYNSTVNVISVITLDRDTRNYIVHTQTAPQNRVLFRRVKLYDQAALGEISVARAYARELGQRIYKPILKTSFKTAGTVDTAGASELVIPYDFVTVNRQPFRVMSIKRNYSADTNDFTTDYECEWLGG